MGLTERRRWRDPWLWSRSCLRMLGATRAENKRKYRWKTGFSAALVTTLSVNFLGPLLHFALAALLFTLVFLDIRKHDRAPTSAVRRRGPQAECCIDVFASRIMRTQFPQAQNESGDEYKWRYLFYYSNWDSLPCTRWDRLIHHVDEGIC